MAKPWLMSKVWLRREIVRFSAVGLLASRALNTYKRSLACILPQSFMFMVLPIKVVKGGQHKVVPLYAESYSFTFISLRSV
jgi:hypothetical protein